MKKILVGTILGWGIFLPSQEANAKLSPEMETMPEMMKKMAVMIDQSSNTDIYDAQGQLCKEGGLIRGRLFTAGRNCKAQDPARMAYLMCDGVTDFQGSTCDKNIMNALGKEGKEGAESAFINSVKGGTSPVYKLICTGDAQFKRKLPGKLKGMDRYCPVTKEQTVKLGPAELGKGSLQPTVRLGEADLAQGRLPEKQTTELSEEDFFPINPLPRPAQRPQPAPKQQPLPDERAGMVVSALQDLKMQTTSKRASLPPMTAIDLDKVLNEIDQKAHGDIANASVADRKDMKNLIDRTITTMSQKSMTSTVQSDVMKQNTGSFKPDEMKAVNDVLKDLNTVSFNLLTPGEAQNAQASDDKGQEERMAQN